MKGALAEAGRAKGFDPARVIGIGVDSTDSKEFRRVYQERLRVAGPRASPSRLAAAKIIASTGSASKPQRRWLTERFSRRSAA